MNWAALSSIFLVATFKFMFSPFPGPHIGLHFYETYLAAFSGGCFSSAIFYFASDFLWNGLTSERSIKKIHSLNRG